MQSPRKYTATYSCSSMISANIGSVNSSIMLEDLCFTNQSYNTKCFKAFWQMNFSSFIRWTDRGGDSFDKVLKLVSCANIIFFEFCNLCNYLCKLFVYFTELSPKRIFYYKLPKMLCWLLSMKSLCHYPDFLVLSFLLFSFAFNSPLAIKVLVCATKTAFL